MNFIGLDHIAVFAAYTSRILVIPFYNAISTSP
jgi:hypothetical protein